MLVFSDESRSNLSNNDGRVRVWRTYGERLYPKYPSETQKNNPPPNPVRGCIGRPTRGDTASVGGEALYVKYNIER